MAEYDWMTIMMNAGSTEPTSVAFLLPENYVRGSGYTDDIGSIFSYDPNLEYWMYSSKDGADICEFKYVRDANGQVETILIGAIPI